MFPLFFYKHFVIFLPAQDVFTLLDQGRYANLDLSAHVSFFEIYNGKVRKTKPISDQKKNDIIKLPNVEMYFFKNTHLGV